MRLGDLQKIAAGDEAYDLAIKRGASPDKAKAFSAWRQQQQAPKPAAQAQPQGQMSYGNMNKQTGAYVPPAGSPDAQMAQRPFGNMSPMARVDAIRAQNRAPAPAPRMAAPPPVAAPARPALAPQPPAVAPARPAQAAPAPRPAAAPAPVAQAAPIRAPLAKAAPRIPSVKVAAELTASGRKHIAGSNFALPGRRYPIHDRIHARNALARVAQHGTPSEQSAVRSAVHRKFPGIGEKK